MPKYPYVTVVLGGEGNAYAMVGACMSAARRCGLDEETITAFKAEATAGNYDHLVTTCSNWFDVV